MAWTLIALICLGLLAAVGLAQSPTLRANRHVWGRPARTEEAFADAFFPPEQRAAAIRVRRALAPYLPVNIARIEPDDRLAEDLGLAARLAAGLDCVAFVQDLEAEFKIAFDAPDFERLRTFRDAVSLVAGKISGRPAPPA